MMNFMLFTAKLAEHAQLTVHEVAGSLIAAAIHDYAHPGYNNNFLVNSED
jgi:hypothetical protein